MRVFLLSVFSSILIFAASCCNDNTTQPANKKTITLPKGNTLASGQLIRIDSLLPNPAGNDDYNERFFITNYGSTDAAASDYFIKDDENVTWALSFLGILEKGKSYSIVSDKVAQLLNSGDTIFLMCRDTIVQTITWGAVADGKMVYPEIITIEE